MPIIYVVYSISVFITCIYMNAACIYDIDFHRIKFDPDASCEFAVRYGNMAKWHL